MKNKLFSIFTALAMVLGILVSPFTSAYAADGDAAATVDKTTNIYLHKLLMTSQELEKWDSKAIEEKGYNATQNVEQLKALLEQGHSADDIDKVFFAVKNSDGKYIGKDGKALAENLQDPTAEGFEDAVLGGRTVKTTGLNLDVSNLEQNNTEYEIVEIPELTTYKGQKEELLAASKAVPVKITLPITNNDGVVKEAHVYPKNTQEKPDIDKNFKYNEGEAKLAGEKESADGAEETVGANYDNYGKTKEKVTSELGKKIPYEVKTKIPAKAKYKKLVWDDQMQEGLVYNKDLTISGLTLEKGTDYKLYETNRGFRLVMQDSGLKKVEEAAANGEVELTLTYSAHLDGTVKPDQVKENNVTFDYSNKPGFEKEPTEVTPSNKEIEVSKTWASDGTEITEADRHVKALFTLQVKEGDNWVDVETYESNYAEDFTHTFTGLDDNKTYRVVESVSGYEPEYQTTDENGKVVIVNKIDKDNPKTLKPTNPKVVNGGKRFVKTDSEDTPNRLAGAEFYVKDSTGKKYLVAKSSTEADAESIDVSEKKKALDDKVAAYNKLSKEEQEGEAGKTAKAAIDKAQDEYNKAFVKAAQAYEWKEADKAPTDAVVLVSDSEGRLEITGLQYGEYKLEEAKAPEGFAKLNGTVDFKVEKGSYDSKAVDGELDYKQNKEDGTQVFGKQIENKNVSIPQTGGIGSLIFVVAGLAIMAFAYTAYKKSQYQEA